MQSGQDRGPRVCKYKASVKKRPRGLWGESRDRSEDINMLGGSSLKGICVVEEEAEKQLSEGATEHGGLDVKKIAWTGLQGKTERRGGLTAAARVGLIEFPTRLGLIKSASLETHIEKHFIYFTCGCLAFNLFTVQLFNPFRINRTFKEICFHWDTVLLQQNNTFPLLQALHRL